MNKSSCYNIVLSIVSIMIWSTAAAQHTKTHEVNESWPGVREVNVEHRYGLLEVVPYTGSAVKLEATMKVIAKEAVDAQTVLDHFQIQRGVSGGKLTLRTQMDTKNWITNNGNTKITFKDGDKVSNIKEISIDYKLYVPSLEKMLLTNKYEDIRITEDFAGALTVHQYDADVTTEAVKGNLDLNLKYGSATIASCVNAKMEIYDSKVDLQKASAVKVNSKYSEYSVGNASSLEMQTYDDKIEITDVAGNLSITDKYSEFKIGSAGSLDMHIYDSDMRLEKCGKVTGESKYTEYNFGTLAGLDLRSSYDDTYEIQQISTLAVTESKYSDFTVAKIDQSIIYNGYDGKFIVREVAGGFNQCALSIKYVQARIPLSTIAGYKLEADTKYGSLKYPSPTASGRHIEKSGQLEVTATIGQPVNGAKVVISAYSSDVRLD